MAVWGAYPQSAGPLSGAQRTYESLQLPFTGTFNVDDVLIVSGGVLSKSGSNPAGSTLAGLALKNSADIYFVGVGGSNAVTDQALFGGSTVGTPLTPGNPQWMEFYPFHNGNVVEMSLSSTNGLWNPGTNVGPGSVCGIALDPGGTGYFVLDPTISNKPFEIIAPVQLTSQPWAVGDYGIRVLAFVPQSTALGI